MSKYLAVDIETTGLCPFTDSIVGIAIAGSKKKKYFTDLKDPNLLNILKDKNYSKIFHNATFDLKFLKHNGFEVNGNIHDTMLLAYLINPDDKKALNLKSLSETYLADDSIKVAKELWEWLDERNLKKDDTSKAPKELLERYALEDVRNTYDLFFVFSKKLVRIKKWMNQRGYRTTPIDYYQEELIPMIDVIIDMELNGVKLDLEKTAKYKLDFTKKMEQIKQNFPNDENTQKVEKILYDKKVKARIARNKTGKIKKMPPPIKFNWDSNEQLKLLLFKVLKEKPTKKTKKGQPSIKADVLETFKEKYEWVESLLEYKLLSKLSSTYLKNLLELQKGTRIYANFNLTGTSTGRLSSSSPNMQNLPKRDEIKELFIPEKDHVFIQADYSQLELRIAAHLSNDKLLIKSYKDGLDLHQMTADIVGVDRALGKTLNFAIIYNASGWRVAEILGYMSGIAEDDMDSKMIQVQKADDIISTLFDQYKGLKAYLKDQKARIYKDKVAVSEFGLMRRLTGLLSDNKKDRNHAFKAGFNLPIQSYGASITKRGMVELNKQFKIVNQVHDSVYIEINKKEAKKSVDKIKEIMENVVDLKVPLLVEPKITTSFKE